MLPLSVCGDKASHFYIIHIFYTTVNVHQNFHSLHTIRQCAKYHKLPSGNSTYNFPLLAILHVLLIQYAGIKNQILERFRLQPLRTRLVTQQLRIYNMPNYSSPPGAGDVMTDMSSLSTRQFWELHILILHSERVAKNLICRLHWGNYTFDINSRVLQAERRHGCTLEYWPCLQCVRDLSAWWGWFEHK